MKIVDLPQMQFIIENEVAAIQLSQYSFNHIAIRLFILLFVSPEYLIWNLETIELLTIIRHRSIIIILAI